MSLTKILLSLVIIFIGAIVINKSDLVSKTPELTPMEKLEIRVKILENQNFILKKLIDIDIKLLERCDMAHQVDYKQN